MDPCNNRKKLARDPATPNQSPSKPRNFEHSTKAIGSPHFTNRNGNETPSKSHSSTTGLKRKIGINNIDSGESNPKSVKGVPVDILPKKQSAIPAADSQNVFSPKKTRSRTKALSGSDGPATSSASSQSKPTRNKKESSIPQFDGANDVPKKSSTKKTRRRKDDSDSDFEPNEARPTRTTAEIRPPKKNLKSTLLDRVKHIDRRVLSTDDEGNDDSSASNIAITRATHFWPEIYCEKEQKWIAVDLLKAKVDAVETITVSKAT